MFSQNTRSNTGFRLAMLCALAGLSLAPNSALAEASEGPSDGAIQLRPNLNWSIGRADGDRTHGFGLDLELRVFPNRSPFRYGGFVGGDLLLDGSRRASGGLSGGFGGFGMQLGVAHRTEADGYAASTGLVIAKTFTWGPAGFAYRMTVPLVDHQPSQGAARLRERGLEHTFMFSLGWSFNLAGERPVWGHCHHHSER